MKQHRESIKAFWEQAGGASDFNAEWKQKVLQYLKRQIERQGYDFGKVILDVGSGINPVSRFIAEDDSLVLSVDFNKPAETSRHRKSAHLQSDIHDLLDPQSFATKRGKVSAARLLEKDPRKEPETAQVDTVIISDLLNYVPMEKTLRSVHTYLKPGGILVIFNQPGRTFNFAQHTLDPRGATTNAALYSEITDTLGYQTIYETETTEGYLVGVFQKPNVTTDETD